MIREALGMTNFALRKKNQTRGSEKICMTAVNHGQS